MPVIVKGIILTYPLLGSIAAHGESSKPNEIYLSTGEQKELTLCNLNNFSIGNKTIVSVRHKPKNCQLLVKAKKAGFTDLKIWKNSKSTTFSIYVSSPENDAPQHSMAKTLKSLGLTVEFINDSIYVQGEINELYQYQFLKRNFSNNQRIYFSVELSEKLRNSIFKKIYLPLYKAGAGSVVCSNQKLNVICEIEGIELKNPELISLEKAYLIQFKSYTKEVSLKSNYYIKFKLYKVSVHKINSRELPLDSIQGEIKDILSSSWDRTMVNKSFHLNDSKLNFRMVATPSQLTSIDEEIVIKLGEDIPYTSATKELTNTQWVFAGLKIKGKLSFVKGRHKWSGLLEISSPSGKSITKASDRTSIYLNLNQDEKVFSIDLEAFSKQRREMPLLGKIPLLGELFSSEDRVNRNEHLYVVMTVEER